MIRKLKKGEFGTYINFNGTEVGFKEIGYSEVYVDNNNFLHNEDGKASLIWNNDNGTIYKIQYNFHSLIHNLFGSAIIYYNEDGTIDEERYGIFGKRLTKQEWELEVNRIKMLEEI